jgi:hypothetical protein
MNSKLTTRRWIRSATAGTAALAAAGIMAGAVSAPASASAPAPSGSPAPAAQPDRSPQKDRASKPDPTKTERADKRRLSASVEAKIKTAVHAEFPDAKIVGMEKGAHGAYTVHLVNAHGKRLTVTLSHGFTVIKTGPWGGPARA